MLRNAVQPWHLLIVLVVLLLVFGSKKLPDMARSLGRSMRILKSEARALRTDETP
ncbi:MULTISPECIES: Sec-independent protein translocase subunit TatA [unclassified Streptomyces]|uniref:Sec-independent protein translocase subunit TatA n=1 Tax=unclassified Streptomyces TaxID=2593676 RepID=UPI0004490455|nr:Sec-independent protein translocase subunit TatA [Streptomyces sp. PCS3-D2]WKV72664.1 Sec-independent protein translocase subunit TatA [Streptomyces sp. PCS3-D2]